MHIPDGFLDAKTAAAAGTLACAGLGAALWQARTHLPHRRAPLLGLTAAFVFAAQMLNFPVAGGTSGHLIGGVLCAVLLGPSAAVIVLSAVLIVQCVVFADGGLTALGANIFNMGLVGGVGGWAIYRALRAARIGITPAAALAAWCGTVLASIVCAGELAASHTVPWRSAFWTMAGIHMLIGVGEAIITVLVLSAIRKTRPELLAATTTTIRADASNITALVAFGLLISIGLAVFVAPFASPWPDGLDWAAERLGFVDRATEERPIPAPAADYQMPGVSSEALATSAAGAAGTIVVFALAWTTAKAILPKARRPDMAVADGANP